MNPATLWRIEEVYNSRRRSGGQFSIVQSNLQLPEGPVFSGRVRGVIPYVRRDLAKSIITANVRPQRQRIIKLEAINSLLVVQPARGSS